MVRTRRFLLPRLRRPLLAAAAVGLALGAGTAAAEVESRLAGSLPLGAETVDVATTADGRRVYVLLAGGTVKVLDASGKDLGQLQVPSDARALAASPDGGQLLVTTGQAVQVFTVNLVQQLDVSGSPFRGPADAPVTVAVFNDFQ